jgi:hypothetical protein
MPGGTGGPRRIQGVGFWAQQKYYNIFSVDSGPFIFRPPLKGLPDQPFPPNAFQSWTYSYNLNLIGKDRFPSGEQVYDRPTLPIPPPALTWTASGTFPPMQAGFLMGVTIRPPLKGLPEQPPQLLQPSVFQAYPTLYTAAAPTLPVPLAKQATDLPQQSWRLEQTWTFSYNKNLIGRDAMLVGEQIYDLAPSQRVPDQIQLRSWAWSYNLSLVGKDRLPAGEQVFELAIGQRPPEQIQLHSWSWSYNLNLRGKDQLPTGEQVYELAPAQKPAEQPQLRVWTWFYNVNLIGQDKLPIGAELWERPTLPIPPAQTWIQTVTYEEIAKPFAQYDWPNATPPYRIEQTWAASYNANLIGQDKMLTGEQITDLPPRDFLRLLQTWIEQTNLALLTTPPALVPRKGITDWPLPLAPPRLDQTWTASYNANLIGQDQLPFRQQDWPNPIAPAQVKDWIQQTNLALLTIVSVLPFLTRNQDWPVPRGAEPDWRRSWEFSYNKNLIGKDQLPIGAELYDLAPGQKPAEQPQLRVWTWWYNQNLISQDQLPFRQQDWPLTPAAQRAVDLATWIDRTKFILLRPFVQTDWPNPTAPFRDPTLGTIARGYNLDLLGQDRLPNRQQDWPLSLAYLPTLLQSYTQPSNIALIIPTAQLPPGVQFFGIVTNRPQLRADVPADLYTISHSQQIPQPTPVVTPAVYNKPMLAGPGYLDVIPGEKPS